MKGYPYLELERVFFEALEYPEFARPNFYINKQKESKWSKGVYLTALSEVYHSAKLRLQMHYNAKKRSANILKLEDFKITIKELFEIDNEKQIDKQTLDNLYYSIEYAWRFDSLPKSFSNYQIISFVEVALSFIKREFYEQAKKTKDPLPRPRTRTYFTYLIAQDGPFFDFPKFKNAIRELSYTSLNIKKVEALLISIHKLASEIVKLWNEEIYFIEVNANEKPDGSSIERARVEFYSESLELSWWSDDKLFDNLPHKFYLNQDFASYAAKIANLVNSEIRHETKTKTEIKTLQTLSNGKQNIILFLGASPINEVRIRIDEEQRDIERGLLMASLRDQFQLKSKWAVTTQTLQQAILEENPTIVHFAGHGDNDGISVEDSLGNAKVIGNEAIGNLFELFSDHIKCVVLNSCYSESQANEIVKHIPHVIGMKSNMNDRSAISFAVGFYTALGAGKDIQFAYKMGVVAIQLDGLSGGDIPVLLNKNSN